jgi:hypothetical protein
VGWGRAFAILFWGARAAMAQVGLELRIPEAETHVLGDVIPLHWRFSNTTAQPLGFLWEGCCRLNGRLEVRSIDQALPMLPTGQALAHMFAKADRLEPGVPKEYETRIADWVNLPGTGVFELRGTYRGVLPTQSPQVPRGLALWREAAESPPVRVRVLGVEDYLAQRAERTRRRGVSLTLRAPDRLPPTGSVTLRLTASNATDRALSLFWPDSFTLWALNSQGERSVPAAVIPGSTVPLSLPPGGAIEREFTLGADRFEGEPLGDYRLFAELTAGNAGEPRVPSAPVPISWRLGRDEVAALVASAAQGAGVGARNAPLRLLRVYLTELASDLEALDLAGWPPASRELGRRLLLAARLKPVQPKPGTVDLRLALLPRSGAEQGVDARWSQAPVRSALRPPGRDSVANVAEELGVLLGVRRHLGWEVDLGLEPGDVSVDQVFAVARSLESQGSELAGPLAAILPGQGTNGPVRLILRTDPPVGEGPWLRIGTKGLSRSLDGRTWESLAGERVAAAPVSAGGGTGWRGVLVEGGLRWESLAGVLELVPGQVRRMDLHRVE